MQFIVLYGATKSSSIPFVVTGIYTYACATIPCALGLKGIFSGNSENCGACEYFIKTVSSPCSFHCFLGVTDACLPFCMGAHGWVARLPVKAPGCLRNPTST